jgi:hypothetical protein
VSALLAENNEPSCLFAGRADASSLNVECLYNGEADIRPYEAKRLDRMASRVILKWSAGPMQSGNHFGKVLPTFDPSPGRVDEDCVFDTLVRGHGVSRPVVIPTGLEPIG